MSRSIRVCIGWADARQRQTRSRELAVAQWTQTVAFRETILTMHADGLRVFVDVGARGNLAGIRRGHPSPGKPSFAVAANVPAPRGRPEKIKPSGRGDICSRSRSHNRLSLCPAAASRDRMARARSIISDRCHARYRPGRNAGFRISRLSDDPSRPKGSRKPITCNGKRYRAVPEHDFADHRDRRHPERKWVLAAGPLAHGNERAFISRCHHQ